MFSSDLSTIALGFSAFVIMLIAVWAWYAAYRAQNYSRACTEYIELANKRSQSLRRIAELEGTVTELADSYHALLKSHKKLRSRIGMREVRKRRKDEENDPPEHDLFPRDPGAPLSKAELRLQCKAKGLIP